MSTLKPEEILQELDKILAQRKNASPKDSYVASLHAKGLNKILEKIGEEATETIIAAKDAVKSGENNEVIGETADLWFHTLIMLSELGTSSSAVLEELAKRFKISGLEEKAGRKK